MNQQEKHQLKETATTILSGLLASGDFTALKISGGGEGHEYPKNVTVVNDGAVEVAVDLAMKLQIECDKRSSSAGD